MQRRYARDRMPPGQRRSTISLVTASGLIQGAGNAGCMCQAGGACCDGCGCICVANAASDTLRSLSGSAAAMQPRCGSVRLPKKALFEDMLKLPCALDQVA